jgi:hypothetical protein
MAGTRGQYTAVSTRAALKLLVQVSYDLRDLLDQVVFVGGIACVLLFPQDMDPHDGTKDLDLALNPARMTIDTDETLEDLLMNNLYQQDTRKRYKWDRSVPIGETAVRVEIG